jgi:hypothetical protein
MKHRGDRDPLESINKFHKKMIFEKKGFGVVRKVQCHKNHIKYQMEIYQWRRDMRHSICHQDAIPSVFRATKIYSKENEFIKVERR